MARLNWREGWNIPTQHAVLELRYSILTRRESQPEAYPNPKRKRGIFRDLQSQELLAYASG